MRGIRIAAIVLGVQAALIVVYLVVEQRHATDGSQTGTLGVAPPEPVDIAAPPLSFERPDGSPVALREASRPLVLHFWATWCPPCREELPRFLAMRVPDGVDVLAVSLDSDRGAVERFVATLPRARLAFGRSAGVLSALGDRSLPVTYVMDASGRLRWRFVGARDWGDPRVERAVALGVARR